MAIEYIPLTAFSPEDGEVLDAVKVKAEMACGKLRLTITKMAFCDDGGSLIVDIILDPKDIDRAWMALRPEEEW